MSAGEAVAAGFRDGSFQGMKIGVTDPGPGDAAEDLEELIGHIAKQANPHQIIALVLIHTPENNDGDGKKGCFFAQVGDQQHELIEPGQPDLLQKIQKFHGNLRYSQIFTIVTQFSPIRKKKYKQGVLPRPAGDILLAYSIDLTTNLLLRT